MHFLKIISKANGAEISEAKHFILEAPATSLIAISLSLSGGLF